MDELGRSAYWCRAGARLAAYAGVGHPGRRTSAHLRRQEGVLLGERLATSLGKKVGDKISLFDNESYNVVGVFKSGTVYENGSMTVLLRDLRVTWAARAR